MQEKESSIIIDSLQRFADQSDLQWACQKFLEDYKFHIRKASPAWYKRGSINDIPLSQFLNEKFIASHKDIIDSILTISAVGASTANTFKDNTDNISLEEIADKISHDRYKGLNFYCIDIDSNSNVLKRAEIAALSRAFNRDNSNRVTKKPVVIFIRHNDAITLSTCERKENARGGERIEKVTMLKDIDCKNPHPGHINILSDLRINIDNPSFDDVYSNWFKTFNNELLTKKFYRELSAWNAWALQHVRFPNDIQNPNVRDIYNNKQNKENIIRLITRLIFVWFLKEKRLIPKEFFEENYIKEHLIENFDPNTLVDLFYKSTESRYYKAILQNLFFATLNCPIIDDDTREANNRHFGKVGCENNNSKVMKYKHYFINPALYLKMANSVPFLNGGLFDCLDDGKRFFYDGFSEDDKISNSLIVPDFLFFGEEVGKDTDLSGYYNDSAKKHVPVRGIIDILKRYQFTIEENTPYIQEVSLDPELLGKVFENLLAEYNPETGSTVRKSSGSYYTPREVVQYMVNESLVDYLKKSVDETLETEYRKLLSYSNEEISLNDDVKRLIIQSIYNCKVLDPACGSGAFPVGMLQQMVHILSKVDPENKAWHKLIIDVASTRSREAYETESTVDLEERTAEINSTFRDSLEYPNYARKLYIIENCIHGVDIQPIAIQISHLRFFISLIVDQKETDDPTSNFGIRPLPNLESKFVSANSIIPLKKNVDLFSTSDEIQKLERLVNESNHRIFMAKNPIQKGIWRKKCEERLLDLKNALIELGYVSSSSVQQLSTWNKFDQNSTSSFFDPEWMFGIKNGFNIIIGNPPYIKEDENRAAFNGFREESPYYMGKMDIWYAFACYGIDWLSDNGTMCYIAQNNWVTSDGAKKLRNKITEQAQIKQFVDFGDYRVFESASIQTMVMLFEKSVTNVEYKFDSRQLLKGASLSDFISVLNHEETDLTRYSEPLFNRSEYQNQLFTFSNTPDLLSHIAKDKIRFDKKEIGQGIIPALDDYFTISDPDKYSDKEKTFIKPFFTGVLDRYKSYPIEKYLIYMSAKNFTERDLSRFPNFEKHFAPHKDELVASKIKYKTPNKPFFFVHRERDERFFKEGNEKIVSQIRCDHPRFYYTKDAFYGSRALVFIQSERWNMKFLTALLNSKLIEYWLREKGKTQGTLLKLDEGPLMNIPLPKPDSKIHRIVKIAEITIQACESGQQALFEKNDSLLNALIFRLYNLEYEEVLIIDPSFGFSKVDYENIEL